MIADYFLIRKASLSLDDLYAADGIYECWNGKALAALAAGVAVALLGLVVPGLRCSTTTPGSSASAWRSCSTGR